MIVRRYRLVSLPTFICVYIYNIYTYICECIYIHIYARHHFAQPQTSPPLLCLLLYSHKHTDTQAARYYNCRFTQTKLRGYNTTNFLLIKMASSVKMPRQSVQLVKRAIITPRYTPNTYYHYYYHYIGLREVPWLIRRLHTYI